MKRKKSPPSEFLIRSVEEVTGDTKAEVQKKLRSILSEVRYAGDMKQLAEKFGLHYLKSKRMRTRELSEWIINNHPAVKKAGEGPQPKLLVGVDFGSELDKQAVTVLEELPDGSFRVLSAEVENGTGRTTKADRRSGQG